ncbi:MAG: PRC-barrel domain-containing protein [Halofilum sp. (in: g-proteobacteria)]|nr:PRC-barrel domain-containing protein [Halofilum sp. (in: g-proteobacteria)]
MKHHLRYTVAALLIGVSGSASATTLDDFDDEGLADEAGAPTAVLGGEAVGDEGNRIGSVHELVIGDKGLVQEIVITRSPNNDLDQQYLEVPWSEVTFKPGLGEASLSFTADEADKRSWLDLPPAIGASEWKVSRMIGMDVDSVDDVAQGEVENVLISEGTNDMSAYVIESEISDETFYALPGDPSFVDYDDNELELPYTAATLEDLPDLGY